MTPDDDEPDRERERDPFGRLEDDVGDREGDPFDELSGPGDGGDDEDVDGAAGGQAGEGIQEVSEPQVRPGTPEVDDAGREAGIDAGAPDPADRGDPFADDSAFQKMAAGEIDEEEVWEQITDARARGSVSAAAERDYAEVSKHRYCEHCEYFTEPPEVRCTHDGTEILEFVDAETVRVADCPVVAERRSLRRGSGDE